MTVMIIIFLMIYLICVGRLTNSRRLQVQILQKYTELKITDTIIFMIVNYGIKNCIQVVAFMLFMTICNKT